MVSKMYYIHVCTPLPFLIGFPRQEPGDGDSVLKDSNQVEEEPVLVCKHESLG